MTQSSHELPDTLKTSHVITKEDPTGLFMPVFEGSLLIMPPHEARWPA